MNCRFCNTPLTQEFVDLASSPPSNSFLAREDLNRPETYYPLRLFVCSECFLVQLDEYKKSHDIFNDKYVYFSSFSSTWREHAKRFVAQACDRLGLNENSRVVEVASNDGYLLRYVKERNIPCFGVEPSGNTAAESRRRGLECIEDFFGERLGRELAAQNLQADLIVANNVLAHVPDINDFLAGFAPALKPRGVASFEFPHLLRLVEENQFDTIYHEHYSYLSFSVVDRMLEKHGLRIFDVEELPTHGGSLRVWACLRDDRSREVRAAVASLMKKELEAGLSTLDYYCGFQERVQRVKINLVSYLIEQKRKGKVIAAYGAAAKGNTLLNYCGIRSDLVAFVADASPHKVGLYLPGSHIPVVDKTAIAAQKPNGILILPWNIKEEILQQLSYVKAWGANFLIPIPRLEIIPSTGQAG